MDNKSLRQIEDQRIS